MDLWVTLGLFGVLGAIGTFLVYFISSSVDSNDSRKIDRSPD